MVPISVVTILVQVIFGINKNNSDKMKRNLIYGGLVSLAAASFLFSSCSSDKDDLGRVEDEKAFVRLTATVDGFDDALRASFSIVDLNTLNPSYSNPEKFKWSDGDSLVALSKYAKSPKGTCERGIKVAAEEGGDVATLKVQLPGDGKVWFLYPSSSIKMQSDSSAYTAEVSLPMETTQNINNQMGCIYLRTDSIELKGGVAQSNIHFNHLTSLIRFHVLNATSHKYMVRKITISSESKDDEVFASRADYKIASKELIVTSNQHHADYVKSFAWENLNYDEYSCAPMVDDNSTEAREDIYDALLAIFPVSAEKLLTKTLTVEVQVYDFETGVTITLDPKVYNPNESANVKKLFANGFPRGQRTYFNLKIEEIDNELKLEFASEEEYAEGPFPQYGEENELTK